MGKKSGRILFRRRLQLLEPSLTALSREWRDSLQLAISSAMEDKSIKQSEIARFDHATNEHQFARRK